MESRGRPAHRTQPPPLPRNGSGRLASNMSVPGSARGQPAQPRDGYGGVLRLCVPWVSRPAVLLLKVLAILLPVTGLGLGLTYLRLLQGPISLHFLLTPIEQALRTELPGVVVDVEDAIVRLSERGRIEFRLKNIQVHENDGDILALAPLAAVRLSTRALMSGHIAPSRIELIEPRFLIARDADGQLSVSFARAAKAEDASAVPQSRTDGASGVRAENVASSPATPFRRLDLARTVSEASARARRRVDAASFLGSVGFKDAVLIYDADGRRSSWRVPEFDIRLKHEQSRSIISGSGAVAAGEGEWTFSFRTEDSPKAKTLRVDASIQDLVPRALVHNSPHFAMLNGIDLPISGTGSIELSAEGEVLGGHFGLDLEPGRLYLPWLDHVPHTIGSGRLDVRYAGDQQRFDFGPSTLSWGRSHAVVGGAMTHAWAANGQSAGWQFDLRTLSGVIAAEDFDVPPLNIDRWTAKGRVGPEPGRLQLDELKLQAGGAQIAMTGHVASMTDRIDGRLEGQIGPMPMATVKALWPGPLARRTRTWIGPNLIGGTLKGGSFVMATSREVGTDVRQDADPSGRRLLLTLEAADVEISTMEGLPPVLAPRALLRVEGNDAEVTIPEASIANSRGERIALRSGRLFAANIDSERPMAELSVRAQAPLAATLDFLSREPISLGRETGVNLQGLEGKAEGQVRVTLPLGSTLTTADMKLEGKLRITDGRAKDVFGGHDVHGATVVVDATEKSVDVRGDMLLAGVNMKLGWQRLIGVPDAQQPPIKISARLDDSDRTQLGLDLNHMVHGEVPVEVSVQRAGRVEPEIHLVADLTGAELTLNDISWRKPTGRPATLQFDAVKGQQHKTELRNFRLLGENIAIDGWVGLGPDNHAKEYHFPGFSLNVVTNLDVRGVLRPGRVWDVKAQGKVYDGNELFRTLITFGQLTDSQVQAKDRPGLDLTAEIGAVLGASDIALRSVKLRMQKRAEQLTMLDLRGTLDGGKPLSARLRQEPGKPRLFVADTSDAGQALKLIGFYPNMIDGVAELELNLDGKGVAEKTGVLTIRNFRVLGDPIVSEVLQTPDGGRPAIDGGGRAQAKRVVREQFEFERLRAPFSMGNGQLVLDNAHVTGPLVGATVRGKIDYKSQRVQLGGTYVPLSELNRSFAPIPLLGPLLTGPRGEGVLGITFAIEGPMAEPQVIVNPLSFVMPGIFREIFQMAPENPRITPREERPQTKGSKASGPQVRASPPTDGGASQDGPRVDGEALGGWSSETTAPSRRVK